MRILNFFISLCYECFWLCYKDIKTFIFKNGLFLLYFIILKLILKNISNSFFKGIGGILK
ncbi:hypothetical protein D2C82_04540 [Helicobacter pylori]|nr:hypothetical protein D2C82_04540 [Helicobacter pylori]